LFVCVCMCVSVFVCVCVCVCVCYTVQFVVIQNKGERRLKCYLTVISFQVLQSNAFLVYDVLCLYRFTATPSESFRTWYIAAC